MNTSTLNQEKRSGLTLAPVTEQESFSLRLKAALRDAHYPHCAESPTRLAREFNARFSGHAISPHAVRKWLRGEAIPTQEKLRIVARWLGVTAEWLRFDSTDPKADVDHTDLSAQCTPSDLQLIEELQQLDEESRLIARELIRLLVRMNRTK
jgi:transcriptional regulator with XRE-family HTH domain